MKYVLIYYYYYYYGPGDAIARVSRSSMVIIVVAEMVICAVSWSLLFLSVPVEPRPEQHAVRSDRGHRWKDRRARPAGEGRHNRVGTNGLYVV